MFIESLNGLQDQEFQKGNEIQNLAVGLNIQTHQMFGDILSHFIVEIIAEFVDCFDALELDAVNG